MKKILINIFKISLLAVMVIIIAGLFITPKKKIDMPTVQSRYEMPSDLDIDEDKAISKILRNGLLYKTISNSKIMNIDRTKILDNIPKGRVLYHDNANRKHESYPYIFVTDRKTNFSGWIHVKDVGYKVK